MFRLATPQEAGYYKKVLYPVQDRILNAVGKCFGSAFYLSGETALSRFYLNHRLSDDLCLFTETGKVSTAVLRVAGLVENLGFRVEIKHSSPTFGRLLVHFKGGTLKVDLAFDNPAEKPRPFKGFYLDTLKNVAVNKVAAFEERIEVKDLIDLYFLTKEVSLEEVFDLADLKKVPVPYENLLAVNTAKLTGRALLLRELSEKDLEEFLRELKRDLKGRIKRKVEESRERVEETIRALLWDFPFKERRISPESIPVLLRRALKLPLPERMALMGEVRNSACF